MRLWFECLDLSKRAYVKVAFSRKLYPTET
jgi:hypothetical protein